MTLAQMLTAVNAMLPQLEAINEGLKGKPERSPDNRSENAWTAHNTSGDLVTKAKMLRNLLLRMQAEGVE